MFMIFLFPERERGKDCGGVGVRAAAPGSVARSARTHPAAPPWFPPPPTPPNPFPSPPLPTVRRARLNGLIGRVIASGGLGGNHGGAFRPRASVFAHFRRFRAWRAGRSWPVCADGRSLLTWVCAVCRPRGARGSVGVRAALLGGVAQARRFISIFVPSELHNIGQRIERRH